jgi:hypothetical protein
MDLSRGSRWLKLSAVLAGCALTCLMAWLAVDLHMRHTQGPARAASSGMYAAGDAMFFFAVLGFGAMLPLGLVFWFMRTSLRFWTLLARAACVLAATGPLGIGLWRLASARATLQAGAWIIPELFALARTFGSPVIWTALLLGVLLAPAGQPRRRLLGCLAVESLVCVYLVWHWFIAPRLR